MKITKKQIDKAIRKASFTPSRLGPIKIILDVGNMDYYIKRAQEYLILASRSPTKEQRDAYLTLALQLTTVAAVYNEET